MAPPTRARLDRAWIVARRWVTWLALGGLVGVCALRVVGLELDPAAGIVSDSGVFITDEGWIIKSAFLHQRFGQWLQPLDYVPQTHNPLHTLLLRAVFAVGGASIWTARALSVVASWVGLFLLYRISRRVVPRLPSLAVTSLVALSLHDVTYGRLALLEPLGTTLALVAVYYYAARKPIPSLLAAAAAPFVKLSLIGATAVVFGLWAVAAARAYRAGEGREARTLAGALAAGTGLGMLAHVGRQWWLPESYDTYHILNIAGRQKVVDLADRLGRQWDAFAQLGDATRAATLLIAAAAGLALWAWRRRGRVDRTVWAMAAFALATLILIGISGYQPRRYYYPVAYPLALLAVVPLWWSLPRRWADVTVCALVVWHAGNQVRGYQAWLGRDDVDSTAAMTRDVAERIGDEAVTVMGEYSTFVALRTPRARPLETLRVDRRRTSLCGRVRHYRPRYAISAELPDPWTPCLDAVAEVEARYRVMDNYYTGRDVTLWRLRWDP